MSYGVTIDYHADCEKCDEKFQEWTGCEKRAPSDIVEVLDDMGWAVDTDLGIAICPSCRNTQPKVEVE